jgi:hypothetical protein
MNLRIKKIVCILVEGRQQEMGGSEVDGSLSLLKSTEDRLPA